MPGKRWKSAELRKLRRLRREGFSVQQIVSDPKLLPGRTRDSIAKKLGRIGLVDVEISRRTSAAKRMNAEQHKLFIAFLRQAARQPLELIAHRWNLWAAPQGWPSVTPQRVYHWLRKIRVERSRAEAWNSAYCQRVRRQRREERFPVLQERLAARIDRLVKKMKATARSYRKGHPETPAEKCGLCGQAWPLDSTFFHRLGGYFRHSGRVSDEYQTEICIACDNSIDWLIRLYRRFNRPVDELVQGRRARKRAALDRLAALELEAAKRERDRIFRRTPRIESRHCVRCRERWPLDGNHFRHNRGTRDGEPTFRPLCLFCDSHYQRRIRRLKHDGLDPTPLIEERSRYSELARDEQRKAKRAKALKLRREIRRKTPLSSFRLCPQCRTRFPADEIHAHLFWTVGQYMTKTRGRQMCLSEICLFCQSENSAEKRRQKN